MTTKNIDLPETPAEEESQKTELVQSDVVTFSRSSLTPETDAAQFSTGMVAGCIARRLERERDEARGALARLSRAVSRRMMPDEPTSADRMELREAFDAAYSLLENAYSGDRP